MFKLLPIAPVVTDRSDAPCSVTVVKLDVDKLANEVITLSSEVADVLPKTPDETIVKLSKPLLIISATVTTELTVAAPALSRVNVKLSVVFAGLVAPVMLKVTLVAWSAATVMGVVDVIPEIVALVPAFNTNDVKPDNEE